MSSRLRYSEAFYSVQGEGKFVGVPSVFLRTFGCNFRCMNFGIERYPNRAEKLKQGIKYNPEVKQLLDDGVLDKVETFEELPIVHTGCDTYASIYPEFKKYIKYSEEIQGKLCFSGQAQSYTKIRTSIKFTHSEKRFNMCIQCMFTWG